MNAADRMELVLTHGDSGALHHADMRPENSSQAF